MPQAIVKSFASKSGKSPKEVEKAISIAKKEAQDMGKSESKNEKDYWQFVIGVTKRILGLDESSETHGAIIAEAFAASGISSYTEFEKAWKKGLSEEVTVSSDYPELPMDQDKEHIPYIAAIEPERQEECTYDMEGLRSGRITEDSSFIYGGKKVTPKSIRQAAINKMPPISKSEIDELKRTNHAVIMYTNGMVVVDGFKKFKLS